MSFAHGFSGLDRFLHRLAFGGTGLQMAVADIEDRLYAGRYAGIAVDRPVFVTSLPRAGTTLLLEVLAAHPDFATHTYREMPFVLCPLMWHAVSRSFRQAGGARERAHGDGMTVDYDSVEAFEEIVWRAFWPEKYRPDRIALWDADDIAADDEFGPFIANHIRKLIALRRQDGVAPHRYVSKNNANIARLPALARLFPDAVILIPFRNPIDHVGSMLRQHRNFTKIHGEDDFARRYMQGIGHLEFGAALSPIDFGGWLDRAGVAPADGANYWLAYWCAAFEHVLEARPAAARLVSYDACCRAAMDALGGIAAEVGVDDPEPLLRQAHRFRPPVGYDPDTLAGRRDLVDRALALHDRLRAAAIV